MEFVFLSRLLYIMDSSAGHLPWPNSLWLVRWTVLTTSLQVSLKKGKKKILVTSVFTWLRVRLGSANTSAFGKRKMRFPNAFAFQEPFFFFFFQRMNSKSTVYVLCGRQILLFIYCLCTVYRTHNHFIQKKNIKNGSHGIIYTFKNYFATVFFSFQFQFSVFNCIQTDLSLFFLLTCSFLNISSTPSQKKYLKFTFSKK